MARKDGILAAARGGLAAALGGAGLYTLMATARAEREVPSDGAFVTIGLAES